MSQYSPLACIHQIHMTQFPPNPLAHILYFQYTALIHLGDRLLHTLFPLYHRSEHTPLLHTLVFQNPILIHIHQNCTPHFPGIALAHTSPLHRPVPAHTHLSHILNHYTLWLLSALPVHTPHTFCLLHQRHPALLRPLSLCQAPAK